MNEFSGRIALVTGGGKGMVRAARRKGLSGAGQVVWRRNAQLIKILLGMFGLALATLAAPAAAQPYEPYRSGAAANEIYDLLFCDQAAAFQPKPGVEAADWQLILFGDGQDPAKVEKLANDEEADSSVRALAFNWLRAHGRNTVKGLVLGVVVEVPLREGLDVIAAYADGSVRYINQTGKMGFFEPGAAPEVSRKAKQLVELAKPLVARIGPWEDARLPPPVKPNIRITFIVSDGLYFGQGPLDAMLEDTYSGPLVSQGSELLKEMVKQVVKTPEE